MIVPGKVSLYGDSTTAGRNYAERMMARAAGKLAGVSDYARGGNSFADNLVGAGNLFGGLTFAQHVAEVDDAQICLIRLGGNCVPGGWVPGDIQACLGADYLQIAGECLQHVQIAQAAGKRVVLVGTPYAHLDTLARCYGLAQAQAATELQRARNANTAIRCVASVTAVPFIATHGWGGDGKHPSADASSVIDGIHPSPGYAAAVADYLADEIVAMFGL